MAQRFALNLRKAGLSGLFLLAMTTLTFAEPLKIDVQDVAAGRDARTGEPVVTGKMTKESQQAFAAFTQRYVGKPFEFRVDGKMVMTPVIREPIFGGSFQISGNLTPDEANDMVRKIKAGAPVEVEPLEAPR